MVLAKAGYLYHNHIIASKQKKETGTARRSAVPNVFLASGKQKKCPVGSWEDDSSRH